MRQQLDSFDEKEIDRTEAIIKSMTPVERQNPKVLNGSRRTRIARGSGMSVTDVNSLVNRFEQAAKMMKTVAKGGTPQLPGMPAGLGGVVLRKKAKEKKKAGSKSGNPAKRAAALNSKEQGFKPAGSGSGSAFGIGN